MNKVDKKFPYYDPKPLDTANIKTEIKRLEEESRIIRMKFASLEMKAIVAIENSRDASTEKIQVFFCHCGLKNLSKILKPQDSIKEATMKILKKRPWSFFDYILLEKFVGAFCSTHLDIFEDFNEFKLILKNFFEQRLYRVPCGKLVEDCDDSDTSKICVKIDKELQKMTSIRKLEQLKYKLSEVLQIKHLLLLNVKEGCLELTFRAFCPVQSFNELQKLDLAFFGAKKVTKEEEGDMKSHDLGIYTYAPPRFDYETEDICKC